MDNISNELLDISFLQMIVHMLINNADNSKYHPHNTRKLPEKGLKFSGKI